jgi:hypothetical protein
VGHIEFWGCAAVPGQEELSQRRPILPFSIFNKKMLISVKNKKIGIHTKLV